MDLDISTLSSDSDNESFETTIFFTANEMAAEQKRKLGKQACKAKDYRAALKHFTDAITLRPDRARYYGNRSACYLMLASYQNALKDARTAVRFDPMYKNGYVRLAKVCLLFGNLKEAEQALTKFSEIDPLDIIGKDVQYALVNLRSCDTHIGNLMDMQRYKDALQYAERALKIAVAGTKYRMLRGECLVHTGCCEEALEIAASVMKMDPISADAIYLRGLCLYYTGNLDKGFVHFERALQLEPRHPKAKGVHDMCSRLRQLKEQGNTMFESGHYEEAYDFYSHALEVDPQNKNVNCKLLYNRALVSSKSENLQKAVADCTTALETDPQYLKAYLLRGRCYKDLGQHEQSVADYEAALKMDNMPIIEALLREARLALKKQRNYYHVLGVRRTATDEEIKHAYRRKALDHHPDRHTNSDAKKRKEEELKFKAVAEAYTTLSDRQKKLAYDRQCDLEEAEYHSASPAHSQSSHSGIRPRSTVNMNSFQTPGGGIRSFNFEFHYL